MSAEAQMLEQLGTYRILRRVGASGIAEVFLAEDTSPSYRGDRVAVKRIRPELIDQDPSLREGLKSEGALGRFIRHPNVVQTYDVIEEGGQPYLVTEYVDGILLSELLSACHGPLDPSVAAEIARQICEGLSAIHQAVDGHGTPLHVVHQDVNPANVCINRRGDVKLLDMGIARSRIRGQSFSGPSAYLSPEQTRGELELSQGSDQYSVGVVVFEMLSGIPFLAGLEALAVQADQAAKREALAALPPTEDSIMIKLEDIMLDETPEDAVPFASPPPDAGDILARQDWARRELPSHLHALDRLPGAGLDAILGRMLAYDPADRYPTAQQAGAELLRWAWGTGEGVDFRQYVREVIARVRGDAEERAPESAPSLAGAPRAASPVAAAPQAAAPVAAAPVAAAPQAAVPQAAAPGAGTTNAGASQGDAPGADPSLGAVDSSFLPKAYVLGIDEPDSAFLPPAAKEPAPIPVRSTNNLARPSASSVRTDPSVIIPGAILEQGESYPDPDSYPGSMPGALPPAYSGGMPGAQGMPGAPGMAGMTGAPGMHGAPGWPGAPGMAGGMPGVRDTTEMAAIMAMPGQAGPAGGATSRNLADRMNWRQMRVAYLALGAAAFLAGIGLFAMYQKTKAPHVDPGSQASASDKKGPVPSGPATATDPQLNRRLEEPLPEEHSAGAGGMRGAKGEGGAGAEPSRTANGMRGLRGDDSPAGEAPAPIKAAANAGDSDEPRELGPEKLSPYKGKRRAGSARLTVSTSPPGGQVILDGVTVEQAPITWESVPAGQHQLILRYEELGKRDVNILDLRTGQNWHGTWSFHEHRWIDLE